MSRRFLLSAWRALQDTARPRVLVLSLLPLLATGVVGVLAQHLFGPATVASTQAWMEQLTWLQTPWLQALWHSARLAQPLQGLSNVLVGLVGCVLLLLLCLVWVGIMVMPLAGAMVARARYAHVKRLGSGRLMLSSFWSLWIALAGMTLLLISLPLWLVPGLGLILPPLIWGWMTAQLFAFDALVAFATAHERRALLRSHRWTLLLMGVACAYLGALPVALFGLGWLALAALPLITLLALWLYVLAFVFSAFWFVHYLLAALAEWRVQGFACQTKRT